MSSEHDKEWWEYKFVNKMGSKSTKIYGLGKAKRTMNPAFCAELASGRNELPKKCLNIKFTSIS